jgi:hypothetical protein
VVGRAGQPGHRPRRDRRRDQVSLGDAYPGWENGLDNRRSPTALKRMQHRTVNL